MNLCDLAKRYFPLAGRLLLANIFIVSGVGKIAGFAGSAASMAGKMPSLDPAVIQILLVATIVIEIGGGLMILVGWQARWAALAILLWLIPVTFIFHAYWGLDAAAARTQFIQFQKNLAIMGGMLYIIAFGSGPLSFGKDKC